MKHPNIENLNNVKSWILLTLLGSKLTSDKMSPVATGKNARVAACKLNLNFETKFTGSYW